MRSWSAAGSAAEPDTSSRALANPRATSASLSASAASRWYIVGTANSIVASSSSAAAAAAAEKRPRCRTPPPRRTGPSVPRMSPWTWNSGSACATTSSPVHSHACGERVEVRGDRAPRQHGALRRPGGTGRVDDDRRCVLARLGGDLAAARREVDIDALATRRCLWDAEPRRAQQQLGVAVVEDVRELALPRLRVDRRDRHARQQRADHRDRDLRLVHRPGGHALAAGDAVGHRGGRIAQLPVGQRAVAEPQRDLVGRIPQRLEQHEAGA